MNKIKNIGVKAALFAFSTTMLVACGQDPNDPGLEFAPDMYHSIPLDPLSQIKDEPYNPHGMNMRVPAKGSIARGKMGFNEYLSVDTAEVAGAELVNPLQPTPQNLEEGKVLYARFCSPCHGATGTGDGLVGDKFKGVPNYTVGRYATLPAGHIYHVIKNGRGRMLPHGTQVNPEERWKIVMYVQQLQKGGEAASDAESAEAVAQ